MLAGVGGAWFDSGVCGVLAAGHLAEGNRVRVRSAESGASAVAGAGVVRLKVL